MYLTHFYEFAYIWVSKTQAQKAAVGHQGEIIVWQAICKSHKAWPEPLLITIIYKIKKN